MHVQTARVETEEHFPIKPSLPFENASLKQQPSTQEPDATGEGPDANTKPLSPDACPDACPDATVEGPDANAETLSPTQPDLNVNVKEQEPLGPLLEQHQQHQLQEGVGEVHTVAASEPYASARETPEPMHAEVGELGLSSETPWPPQAPLPHLAFSSHISEHFQQQEDVQQAAGTTALQGECVKEVSSPSSSYTKEWSHRALSGGTEVQGAQTLPSEPLQLVS